MLQSEAVSLQDIKEQSSHLKVVYGTLSLAVKSKISHWFKTQSRANQYQTIFWTRECQENLYLSKTCCDEQHLVKIWIWRLTSQNKQAGLKVHQHLILKHLTTILNRGITNGKEILLNCLERLEISTFVIRTRRTKDANHLPFDLQDIHQQGTHPNEIDQVATTKLSTESAKTKG